MSIRWVGRCGVVVLVALVALWCSASAPAADRELPQARAGAALVVIPDGWKRLDAPSGEVAFAPPDDPAGRSVKIIVSPPEPPRPALRDHMEADLKVGREKLAAFQVEGETVAAKHPAGYEVLTQVISFNPNPLMPLRVERAYMVVTHIDGGPDVPSQPIGLFATSKALLDRHLPTYDAFLRAARLPSRTILAEGPAGQPPLTRLTVERVTEFLEWQLDVPFTATQRQAPQDHFVAAWKAGDVAEIDGVRTALAFRKEVEAMPPQRREAERQRVRAAVLDHWRQQARAGHAMARLMIDVHDAGHEAIAPATRGEPPLTRQSADAMLEVLYFMASKAADPAAPEVRPTREHLDLWAKQLAATYAAQPPETKRELAAMPATWAGLRAGWPELSEKQRAELAAQWAQNPAVQPLIEQVKQGQARQLREAQARAVADSVRQVNLYNQLSAYCALRKNYNILFGK